MSGNATREEGASGHRNPKALGILTLATLAALVPFLWKSYWIDDPLFLWAGQHIQSDPVDFYDFDVNWDAKWEPMHAVTKNPPLACYYIAVAAYFVGWSEPALHAAFLLPALGTIWGTWYLARSLCAQPVGAALATLASPVFLISSTNVMCDTMALCFWVWAVGLWVRGLDLRKSWYLYLAAFLVACSALTKYFGVSLIPLLAAYTWVREWQAGSTSAPQPRGALAAAWRIVGGRYSQRLVFLLLPIAILALYQWWTQQEYNRGLLLDAMGFATTMRTSIGFPVWYDILAILCFTGGCFLPAAICAPRLVPLPVAIGGLLFTVGIMACVLLGIPKLMHPVRVNSPAFGWGFALQAGLFAGTGALVWWLVVLDVVTRRSADAWLLALWIFGTVAFAGFVNWTCNGRSVLPMAPALGILVVRRAEDRRRISGGSETAWMWSLIPAGTVAMLAAWGDCRQADSVKPAIARLMSYQRPQGAILWFQGHWGFQYYIQQLGALPIDFGRLAFRKDDLMVIPTPGIHTYLPIKGTAAVAYDFEVPGCPWMSVFDPRTGSGFYASFYGPLPYLFCSGPPSMYRVYRMLEGARRDGPQFIRPTTRP